SPSSGYAHGLHVRPPEVLLIGRGTCQLAYTPGSCPGVYAVFRACDPPDDPPRRSVAPQGGVDPLEQLADLLAGQAVLALLLLLQALQVVGQVQRRHDGDALGADDLAAQADLSHLAVQKARGLLQLGAGIDRTGDAV